MRLAARDHLHLDVWEARGDVPESSRSTVRRTVAEAERHELCILGPGSLFTSVVPNLLFDQISHAIRSSQAPVVYICNVATQVGETDGFCARDHIAEVRRYLGDTELTHVLVNNNRSVEAASRRAGVEPVTDAGLGDMIDGARIVRCDVVSDINPLRHDPEKLAHVLYELVSAQHADPAHRAHDMLPAPASGTISK